MIPWLLVVELMSVRGQSLSQLVSERMRAYPASGEINSLLTDPVAAIARVRAALEPQALAVDETDGVSLTFADWRFNLCSSNTEPVVRFNAESRQDVRLMEEKNRTILALLCQC